jgi:hypothetical protein
MRNSGWMIYMTSKHVFQGSYAGNAAGFRLNTLPKLLDTRANKPRMTFLHFVVQVAEANNKNALAFTKDLSNINKICKYVSVCMSSYVNFPL